MSEMEILIVLVIGIIIGAPLTYFVLKYYPVVLEDEIREETLESSLHTIKVRVRFIW